MAVDLLFKTWPDMAHVDDFLEGEHVKGYHEKSCSPKTGNLIFRGQGLTGIDRAVKLIGFMSLPRLTLSEDLNPSLIFLTPLKQAVSSTVFHNFLRHLFV